MTNQIGDVLVTFENEAEMIAREFGRDQFEVVYPSVSAEAEPPVSVVDKVVDRKQSRALAEAYLKYLWSPEGQEIAAKTTCVLVIRRCWPNTPIASRKWTSSRWRKPSVTGARCRRPTSSTAVCSTRSIRANKPLRQCKTATFEVAVLLSLDHLLNCLPSPAGTPLTSVACHGPLGLVAQLQPSFHW